MNIGTYVLYSIALFIILKNVNMRIFLRKKSVFVPSLYIIEQSITSYNKARRTFDTDDENDYDKSLCCTSHDIVLWKLKLKLQ